jgi:hypothetical protein
VNFAKFDGEEAGTIIVETTKVCRCGTTITACSTPNCAGYGVPKSAPGDNTSAALDDVRERVRSWGGGTATVWARGSDTAVLLNLVDENVEGIPSLCDSMEAWVRAAAIRNAVVDCGDTSVQVGIGPDLDISGSIVA